MTSMRHKAIIRRRVEWSCRDIDWKLKGLRSEGRLELST